MATDSERGGSERPPTDIHLCQGCGNPFEEYHHTISLSEGRVKKDEYHVANRRLFHAECWRNSVYMNTDS